MRAGSIAMGSLFGIAAGIGTQEMIALGVKWDGGRRDDAVVVVLRLLAGVGSAAFVGYAAAKGLDDIQNERAALPVATP